MSSISCHANALGTEIHLLLRQGPQRSHTSFLQSVQTFRSADPDIYCCFHLFFYLFVLFYLEHSTGTSSIKIFPEGTLEN